MSESKILLGTALPFARQVMLEMMKLDPNVRELLPSGALRRGEETLEMLTILAATEDTYETLEIFKNLPIIDHIIRERDYKAEVVLTNGLRLEFITCFPEQLATALVMTTGTQEHRQQLRDLAWKRGYELSLGGFVKGDEIWPAHDEEEVFRYLGLPYIPPELRRGNGEIQAVLQGEMALDLVTLDDIRGDLHVISPNIANLEALAHAAALRGYRYLLVANSSFEHTITVEKLRQQKTAITQINENLANEGFNFQLLSGVEVEIQPDGMLDLPDSILPEQDIVLAGINRDWRPERKELTDVFLKIMRNPHVDIISHPTGRIFNQREPLEMNQLKVFVAARETGTALEINANPLRLDLNADYIQQALDEKAPLVIGSEATNPDELPNLEYGLLTARRGGARPHEILNSLPLDKLLASLKK